jgi:hypothetical protein
LTVRICVKYIFLCTGGGRARDRKGVQNGKRSLFSKTRPSRADPFPSTSPNICLQNKMYLISPLRSKRATLYIDPHGRVCCFGAAKPGRRAKARNVFIVWACHTYAHTIKYSNSHTTHPTPSPPALPARYATLRSQLLQCTLIQCAKQTYHQ